VREVRWVQDRPVPAAAEEVEYALLEEVVYG